ncbi:MAG: hypothetical protein QM731_15550 [Chitinophagaceae bacterium]
MKFQNLPLDILPAADSLEVQRQYCLDRIFLLEEEMERLNLMEHPQAIECLCNQIIELKKILKRNFR